MVPPLRVSPLKTSRKNVIFIYNHPSISECCEIFDLWPGTKIKNTYILLFYIPVIFFPTKFTIYLFQLYW